MHVIHTVPSGMRATCVYCMCIRASYHLSISLCQLCTKPHVLPGGLHFLVEEQTCSGCCTLAVDGHGFGKTHSALLPVVNPVFMLLLASNCAARVDS